MPKIEIARKHFQYKLVIILALFSIIMCGISSLTVVDTIKLFIFQIVLIIVPGMCLMLWVRIDGLSDVEYITLSYFAGFVHNIIAYFLLMLLNLRDKSFCVLIMVSLIYCVVLFFNRKRVCHCHIDYEGGNWLCLGLIILLMIKIFSFYGNNVLPQEGDSAWYFNDTLYYIGNSIEASKEFPLKNFRWIEDIYKYHYFGSLQEAVVNMVTNVSCFKIHTCYSFFWGLFMCVSAFYILASKILKNKRSIIIGLIILFLSTGLDNYVHAPWVTHIFVCTFGFDLGLAFIMIGTFCLIIIDSNLEHISKKMIMLLLILLAMTTGIKGPSGILLLAMIGLFCIKWLLYNEKVKLAVGTGMIACIVFILIYWLFLYSKAGISFTNAFSVFRNWTLAIQRKPVLNDIYMTFCSNSLLKIFAPFLVVIIYLLMLRGYLLISIVIGYVFLKKKKELISQYFNLFLFEFLIGVLLVFSLSFNGESELYFILAVIPFLVLLFLMMWDNLQLNKKYKWLCGVCIGGGVICFLVCIAPSVGRGVFEILNINYSIKQDDSSDAIYVSIDEYNAYEWLRRTTPEDAIVVTNKVFMKNGRACFAPGVFSERYQFINAWLYAYDENKVNEIMSRMEHLERLYNGEWQELEYFSKNNVHYFIVMKEISDGSELSEKYNPIYENEEVMIFYM